MAAKSRWKRSVLQWGAAWAACAMVVTAIPRGWTESVPLRPSRCYPFADPYPLSGLQSSGDLPAGLGEDEHTLSGVFEERKGENAHRGTEPAKGFPELEEESLHRAAEIVRVTGVPQIVQSIARLAALDQPLLLTFLARWKTHESPEVRRAVAEAVGWAGGEIPELVMWLEDFSGDTDPRVRLAAVISVGWGNRSDREQAVLHRAKHDPAESVRWAAGWGLASQGDDTAMPLALSLLKSSDSKARLLGVKIAGVLKARQTVPWIQDLLKDKASLWEPKVVSRPRQQERIGWSYTDIRLALAGMWALWRIGDPAGYEYLVKASKSFRPDIRFEAARIASARKEELPAQRLLLSLLEDPFPDDQPRSPGAQAMWGLWNCREPLVAPALVELTRHERAQVRVRAAKVMGGCAERGMEICEGLLPLLSDGDSDVAQAACEALVRHGDSRILPQLIAVRDDGPPQARQRAAYVLKTLGY